MRSPSTVLVTAVALLGLTAAPAVAQTDLFVYPTKGQDEGQQSKDKAECSSWATQQTNFDPLTPAPVYQPPTAQANTQKRGGAVRGAAGGAALGAIGGAIGGNAGKGAAVGAGVGGGAGAMRQRSSNRAAADTNAASQANADASYQQALAAHNQQRETHKKAMSTCLTGRGYSVQ